VYSLDLATFFKKSLFSHRTSTYVAGIVVALDILMAKRPGSHALAFVKRVKAVKPATDRLEPILSRWRLSLSIRPSAVENW
jgi:hypothetical protein